MQHPFNKFIIRLLLVFACMAPYWIDSAEALTKRTDVLTIGAASSLTDVLKDLQADFLRTHSNTKIRITFAASGVLKQQIVHGAPVDLLLAASPQERTDLVKAGRVQEGAWTPFISNRLALVFRQGIATYHVADLRSSAIKRFVIADPVSVPAGRYSREALKKLGLYDVMMPKLLLAENVRAVHQYLVRGDADAGILFVTDLKSAQKSLVKWITMPDGPKITYEAITITGGHTVTADEFRAYLVTKQAQSILLKYHFTPLRAK